MVVVLSQPVADVPPIDLKIVTVCLGLVRKWQQVYYDTINRNSGIKGSWLIQNSDEVSHLVSEANSKCDVTSIKMYDFSTFYTNLPHTEIKERIPKLVSESFEGLDQKYISIDRNLRAHWTNTKRRSMLFLTPREIMKMVHFLLDNVYIQVGDRVFQQCIGIPWALITRPCSLTCCCIITKAQL